MESDPLIEEVSPEQEFMSWLLADLETEKSLFSVYFSETTEAFPWPKFVTEEDRYSAIVEPAAEYGLELFEAALQYREKISVVTSLATQVDHPEFFRFVPRDDETWLEDPWGYRCEVSLPGFSHSGKVAVVYVGWPGRGGGWGEIRGYRKTAEGWRPAFPGYSCDWVACGMIR